MRAGDAGRFALRALALVGGLAIAGQAVADDAPTKDKIDKGRELFLREWTPGDPRSHGGDGLGPVFNDSSCVACHNSGGAGGAGPSSKNVDILSAFANGAQGVQSPFAARRPTGGFGEKMAEALLGIEPPKPGTPPAPAKPRKPDTKPLIAAHAGFRTTRSVVLHRFGVDSGYETWRTEMLGMSPFFVDVPAGGTAEVKAFAELLKVRRFNVFRGQSMGFQGTAGEFTLARSQRNPTSLFGAGLLDSIPESVLIETAKRQEKENPTIAGRVARQKDGRIGRFGWKAQTPSLNDFVLTACAVELGLEVPGHGQGGLPQSPDAKAKGLDMDADECGAMVAYVKSLAKPAEFNANLTNVVAGRAIFTKIGCASCHMPKLGDVDGVYTDLLVHDLGEDLGDTGQYGVFTPGSSDPEFDDDPIVPPAPGGVGQAQSVDILLADTRAAGAMPDLGLTGRVLLGGLFGVRRHVLLDAPSPFDVAQVAVPAPPPPPPLAPGDSPAPVVTTPALAPGQNVPPTPKANGPAGRQEWRTPPLWGFRDSGPYLHDGRADTMEQAVSLHGGQGQASAVAYFGLSAKERRDLEAFLKSLVAPSL